MQSVHILTNTRIAGALQYQNTVLYYARLWLASAVQYMAAWAAQPRTRWVLASKLRHEAVLAVVKLTNADYVVNSAHLPLPGTSPLDLPQNYMTSFVY